jgi:hypothetical protein
VSLAARPWHNLPTDSDSLFPAMLLSPTFYVKTNFSVDIDSTTPSTVPSTSPLATQPHPRGPTSSASAPAVDDSNWAPRADSKYLVRSPSAYTDLPTQASSRAPVQSFSLPPLLRSASEGESSFATDPISPRSFARPPKSMLPDPSQFPDPYPFRPPHHHLTSTLPALSSAGSSSASTRSSAYTSSGSALASGDYGHVHVAGEDESSVGVGITSDDVVQLLESDNHISSSSLGMHSRAPIDQIRWSESYSGSIRSRSSSLGNGGAYDNGGPKLREKLSYDMGWQTVDERDEVGVSEEETDDDQALVEEEGEHEEERTSAVVVAEEGRGLIVQGDALPIVQLVVHPGESGPQAPENLISSFFFRHHPSLGWLFEHPQRYACLSDVHHPANMHHAPCSRHLREFSRCTPSLPRSLHDTGGAQHCFEPSACSSGFLSRPRLPSCPYRGFYWNQFPS